MCEGHVANMDLVRIPGNSFVEVYMLSIRWIKDEGRLLAVWVSGEPDRPAVPLWTAPSYSPTRNRFHVVDWHSLRKAA